MEKWYVAAKKADFDKWAKEFHISPVTARILRNRDLTEESQIQKFLYGKLEDCYSPWLLKDMDRAVEEILKAVKEGLHIRVIGDYDVDGICSSYILTKGFQMLGAQVDTAIPHRIHDGYGLNEHLIEEAKREGVGMIVTCDNGIAAAPQIELANSLGMRVIVTDHHEVPYIEENGERKEQLPPALAVVDPKRSDDTYPFPGICGGVVALKVIQAITEKTGNPGLINIQDELLEFAALSTVCDVMELKDENRILVKEGLKRIQKGYNEGLKALMEVNEIAPDRLSAYLPEVHESIAGIIAGKVREKYHHPVFILTKGEDGVKGSGRSIEAYHMYDAMTQVKHFFTKYGGHKLAAGLSMREEDIEPLRIALNKNCTLTEDDFIPRVHIDVAMPMGYADEALAGELALLEPFGTGNPKPLFAQKDLIFQAGFKMGANKTCARFRVKTPEGAIQTVVFFGDLERLGAFLNEKYGIGSEEALYAGRGSFPLSVVYQVGQNTYKGRTEVQYIMQNYC